MLLYYAFTFMLLLFSLLLNNYYTNRMNLQTAKVGYSNNGNQHSVHCHSSYGPAFGGGYDIFCHNDGMWYANPHSYPNIDLPGNNGIEVNDYEVFQVFKK